ncbi:hypothetical protein PR048_019243 [Dryococelus australis]|uniref:Uncharacterized protein n=1 Tax=Dryococelus australis TaxID=614101 RepID=A0ABQ9H307_9NEOP|nr:hypothetical protein PR048_019243 [Dryococelus australis]
MSCTTSRCSHLSLMGILSSGRPASYAEPSREGADSRRPSHDQHKPHPAPEWRCVDVPSSHANTPTRTRHQELPGGRKTSSVSCVGSRQTLNINIPLAEENFNETADVPIHKNISKIYYVNECSDRHSSSQNRNNVVGCDERTLEKAHFQSSHDYKTSNIRTVTERGSIGTCVTSKLVTKVECYVKETNVMNIGDANTSGRNSSTSKYSPCDSPTLQCSECHPLLSKEHAAQNLLCNSESGNTTSVKSLYHHSSPPCTNTSHTSCATGCSKTFNSPSHMQTSAPHVACDTCCLLNTNGTCKKSEGKNRATHKHQAKTNSILCVCSADSASDSNIHARSKNSHEHSSLPSKCNEPLGKHCHLVGPGKAKCTKPQETRVQNQKIAIKKNKSVNPVGRKYSLFIMFT